MVFNIVALGCHSIEVKNTHSEMNESNFYKINASKKVINCYVD